MKELEILMNKLTGRFLPAVAANITLNLVSLIIVELFKKGIFTEETIKHFNTLVDQAASDGARNNY